MKNFEHGKYALSLGVYVALLAGCGGSQPGAVPQGAAAQALGHRDSGKSWMKPEAKNSDLLYVGSPSADDVYVYSYPGGTLVGTITGLDDPMGICSDANGNVWITNTGRSDYAYLVEYAHGGTTPIATLDDSGFSPQACAIDATTGNLAVANQVDDVAVWRNARGKRRLYLTAYIVDGPETITYDGSDDGIFADFTAQSGWLPTGDSKVKKFRLRPHLSKHGPFEWDGKYLGVLAASKKPTHEEVIRYKVSGGSATQVGTVPLNGVTDSGQFWIQDSRMVLTDSSAGDVYFFKYPKGGKPTKTISGLNGPYGVTVSVAPSR